MKTFAIREEGTNRYMPAHKTGKGGFSHDEPQENGGEFGPRLLHSKRAANAAISNWRQGYWAMVCIDGGRTWEGIDEGETWELQPSPVAGRESIKLEVVEFNLQEVV